MCSNMAISQGAKMFSENRIENAMFWAVYALATVVLILY
jgi:hypothetical protein